MKKLMCNLLACASLASVGSVAASASETRYLPAPDPGFFNNEATWVETGEGLYADILENHGVMALYSEGLECLKNDDFESVNAIIFELELNSEIGLASSLHRAMQDKIRKIKQARERNDVGVRRNLIQKFNKLNDFE